MDSMNHSKSEHCARLTLEDLEDLQQPAIQGLRELGSSRPAGDLWSDFLVSDYLYSFGTIQDSDFNACAFPSDTGLSSSCKANDETVDPDCMDLDPSTPVTVKLEDDCPVSTNE